MTTQPQVCGTADCLRYQEIDGLGRDIWKAGVILGVVVRAYPQEVP